MEDPVTDMVETIRPHANVQHVYHQYVVMCDRRQELLAFLKAEGVGALIHYPVPLHRQPAYELKRPHQTNGLANSERMCARVLSLPMFPELTDEQVEKTILKHNLPVPFSYSLRPVSRASRFNLLYELFL